jgi:hypothetical protein
MVVLLLLSVAIVVAAVVWAGARIVEEQRLAREEAAQGRAMVLLQMFAPALAAAQADPRALLVWQPLAKSARQLFPAEFASLDRASGARFPFTNDQLQAAHSTWTADWLAWEQHHDAEFKLKAALVEHEVAGLAPSAVGRAKIEAVEREKLELYQSHYRDYVRTAKALQALQT